MLRVYHVRHKHFNCNNKHTRIWQSVSWWKNTESCFHHGMINATYSNNVLRDSLRMTKCTIVTPLLPLVIISCASEMVNSMPKYSAHLRNMDIKYEASKKGDRKRKLNYHWDFGDRFLNPMAVGSHCCHNDSFRNHRNKKRHWQPQVSATNVCFHLLLSDANFTPVCNKTLMTETARVHIAFHHMLPVTIIWHGTVLHFQVHRKEILSIKNWQRRITSINPQHGCTWTTLIYHDHRYEEKILTVASFQSMWNRQMLTPALLRHHKLPSWRGFMRIYAYCWL